MFFIYIQPFVILRVNMVESVLQQEHVIVLIIGLGIVVKKVRMYHHVIH